MNIVPDTYRALSLAGRIATLALALGASAVGAQDGQPSGGAGGGNAAGANSKLQHCDETFGTLAVFEDQAAPWWHTYYGRYPNLGSTTPVLRMLIQQSNCFVVVERGQAMRNMAQERALQQSGELREGSNFGKGQMVSADYTMTPSIQFSAKGTSGLGGAVGSLFGSVAGALAASMKTNEAATTLLLVDNRSSVQIAAAVGSAKDFDFGVLVGAFGAGAAGGAGAFTNTPEGKTITAAFADSYNQMVQALRNYRAQQVKGGLGKGGNLKTGE
jgi:hypothetical protein